MQISFPVTIFQGILLGLSACLFACLLAFRIARSAKLVDVPGREPHKQHPQAIPIAGGIALVFVLLTGWVLNINGFAGAWRLILPSLIVFVIGLLDDFRPLRFWIRLAGQIFAAGLFIVLGVQAHAVESSLTGLPLTLVRSLDVMITLLWLVGISNAYNFVDSMDGLATGLSVIVTIFFSFATLFAGQTELAHFMAYLAGACFVLYLLNFAPAKLFLGDSGALLMGFLLAQTSLLYNPRIFPQLSSWFVPIMVLGLPLFDIVLVVASRLRRRLPVYQADRGHTYHRLVALGFEPGRAVLVMHAASIVLGCLAFIAMNKPPLLANAIFGGVCFIGVGLILYLDHPKRWPSPGAEPGR